MSISNQEGSFRARLLRPVDRDGEEPWAFVVLPRAVSEMLPRRGRTTVFGKINGIPFQETLEPDGQLSHWLRVREGLQRMAGAKAGDTIRIELSPVQQEPEPEIPEDLHKALTGDPKAQAVWLNTTTLARVDWVHWITSARQPKTREKRVRDACEMLRSGKKRVCCFDPSGFYSKALRAPEAAE